MDPLEGTDPPIRIILPLETNGLFRRYGVLFYTSAHLFEANVTVSH